MFSDTNDNSIQPSPDLNRALAEAMSVNHPEIAPLAPEEGANGPDTSIVLKWNAPSAGRKSKQTVLGIDYSPSQLTILEMRWPRCPSVIGLQTVRFEEPPSSAILADLLKEFNPAHHNCVKLTLTSARAVVRQYRIPPVPKRRRKAAAIWEAQKLIPFSLRDSEAIFGFTFAPSVRKGWQVTLAAVPREDVSPILDAIRNAQWTIAGVSIAGTQWLPASNRLTRSDSATTVATVLWSAERASFVVFHQHELKFHYDLGPMPLGVIPNGEEPSPEALRKWLKALEKGIGEAFEFFVGTHPDLAVGHIELFGMPESVAPLVTDWQDQFGAPVSVVNPIRDFAEGLPEDVTEWLASKSATITTAVIAAAGKSTVDMTPAAMAKTRNLKKSERIARMLFLSSIFAALIWTGFLWMQSSLAARGAGHMHVHLEDLKKSPTNSQLQQTVLGFQQIESMAAATAVPAIRWMPYFKSILATLPQDARLASVVSESPRGIQPGTRPFPMMRMDGELLPTERSHALIYADWFGRMESIAGGSSVKLVSDRVVDWKGQRTSIFSIGVAPSIPAEEQTP